MGKNEFLKGYNITFTWIFKMEPFKKN